MKAMEKTRTERAVMSKLRVARGTLIGARECLKDAIKFVDLGIARADEARAEVLQAMRDAGLSPEPGGKKKGTSAKTARRRRPG